MVNQDFCTVNLYHRKNLNVLTNNYIDIKLLNNFFNLENDEMETLILKVYNDKFCYMCHYKQFFLFTKLIQYSDICVFFNTLFIAFSMYFLRLH